ncbi:MAG: hypothetical protein R2711_02685 [Acidimicrobiales bacterium]
MRPLVALGAISYGAYLYHWPLYTLIDEARLGLGGTALLLARLGATVVVATASLHLLERPVRTASLAPAPSLVAAGGDALAVLAASATVPATAPVYETAGDAATAAIDPGTVGPAAARRSRPRPSQRRTRTPRSTGPAPTWRRRTGCGADRRLRRQHGQGHGWGASCAGQPPTPTGPR